MTNAASPLGWVKQLDIDIGVFCVLHTYSRKLNWNLHFHLSVTRGGLCKRTDRSIEAHFL
ncbi:hypothetical protein CGI54_21995 [Vibrio parahaemolyticus]|nr:hypothetical protein CGI54_21995 [Vibrio parahaemolyticus]